LWWFRHLERKDDADGDCMEPPGKGDVRERFGWILSKGIIETFGLTREDAQDRNHWRPKIKQVNG